MRLNAFHKFSSLLSKTLGLVWVPMFALLSGCTSMGAHDASTLKRMDFGPQETLRICVLLDDDEIPQAKGEALIQAVNQELSLYNIRVEVPWYKPWARPGIGGMQIIENLAGKKLVQPCDRILALVGRDRGELLISRLMFEELGSVDTVTHTRGYIFADIESWNQKVTPPTEAVVHETYHLLGCDHDDTMTPCYERIAQLKAAARRNRQSGNDFFPTYTLQGQLILRREEVDLRESMALRVYQARQPESAP